MPADLSPHAHNLRAGRFSEAGRSYLITTVTAERRPLFLDFFTSRLLIQEMRRCTAEGLANSLAWVVMPDHLHWLVTLEHGGLARLAKRLKARSAQAINRHHVSHGRVWQPGYHDRAVRHEDDVRAMARYIVANPLRAGLVQHMADYPHWDAIWL
ncbi:MAG: transposase [Gammaproteobacteria bacterium]|nr:transposase [Gammaproteobacteria bacterium]MBU1489658.1 transposase [Gammaproteobacteria bacterium]MBU2067010.1 transposase [Gammaproteobacteria bacterium]MBU2137553.1 transposase [Gammaproteobacteria bacterium]MBU2216400.1 transposase [Gammaproteobacteria bacterium]